MFFTIILSSEEHTAKPWEFLFTEWHTEIKEVGGQKLNSYSKLQDENYTPISDLGDGLGIYVFWYFYLSD